MRREELGIREDDHRRLTPLRDIDLSDKVKTRLALTTYSPLIGRACKISRTHIKRKRKLTDSRWCILLSNEDYTDILLVCNYKYLVTLGGGGEYYLRKDTYFLNGKEIDLKCIGITHNEYAVCEFRYKEDV